MGYSWTDLVAAGERQDHVDVLAPGRERIRCLQCEAVIDFLAGENIVGCERCGHIYARRL